MNKKIIYPLILVFLLIMVVSLFLLPSFYNINKRYSIENIEIIKTKDSIYVNDKNYNLNYNLPPGWKLLQSTDKSNLYNAVFSSENKKMNMYFLSMKDDGEKLKSKIHSHLIKISNINTNIEIEKIRNLIKSMTVEEKTNHNIEEGYVVHVKLDDTDNNRWKEAHLIAARKYDMYYFFILVAKDGFIAETKSVISEKEYYKTFSVMTNPVYVFSSTFRLE